MLAYFADSYKYSALGAELADRGDADGARRYGEAPRLRRTIRMPTMMGLPLKRRRLLGRDRAERARRIRSSTRRARIRAAHFDRGTDLARRGAPPAKRYRFRAVVIGDGSRRTSCDARPDVDCRRSA